MRSPSGQERSAMGEARRFSPADSCEGLGGARAEFHLGHARA